MRRRPSSTCLRSPAGWIRLWSARQQVLGQVRRAYAAAESNRTVGRVLHELAQRALAVGKRVHTETGIDAAGASVVSVALGMAAQHLGGLAGHDRRRRRRRSDGRAVGQAHLPGPASTALHRQPLAAPRAAAGSQNPRIRRRCEALRAGEPATAAGRRPRRGQLHRSCPSGGVAGRRAQHAGRQPSRRNREPLVICDLGMPRDVDPAVSGLPGVWVIDMDRVQREPSARAAAADAEAARHLVAAEVANIWSDSGWPRSPRRSPRCASVPPTSSKRSCCGWTTGCPASKRCPPRGGRPHGAARRGQAAARPDGAGQTAGQRARRRQLRRGVARALRTRPASCRRRRGGRAAAGRRRPGVRRVVMSARDSGVAIRIGTRGSLLATTQAGAIRDALIVKGRAAELVTIRTEGDRSANPSPTSVSGCSPRRSGRQSTTAPSTWPCIPTKICRRPLTTGS